MKCLLCDREVRWFRCPCGWHRLLNRGERGRKGRNQFAVGRATGTMMWSESKDEWEPVPDGCVAVLDVRRRR